MGPVKVWRIRAQGQMFLIIGTIAKLTQQLPKVLAIRLLIFDEKISFKGEHKGCTEGVFVIFFVYY